MNKFLIILGLILLALGLLWPLFKKLNLGRLPGDVVFKRGDFSFYFPIMTCIVVSIVLSVVLWLMRK